MAGRAFLQANCIFRRCELEMDHASYLRYLISRHASLNLPYPFATKLSFLASPLVLGRATMIHCEDTYENVGAFGFAYGTGPGEYEDRENCQLEVFYIEENRRTPDVLLAAASELVDDMREGHSEARHIQFWVPASRDSEDGRLLRRIASLPEASRTEAGGVDAVQAADRRAGTMDSGAQVEARGQKEASSNAMIKGAGGLRGLRHPFACWDG
ncbi:hypothetical protein [Cohnella rhizosphaerae]|uniref:Uncharacterized protein n=1 Tax=Cohnella rhizosphaerae TaxID=1457232 RepID=A0A9X4KSK5_9BACL|nr:hypothetical protein [Cohnella rhizosphaerae]MDG0810180.1 hypothetical protein [Cohnella rhizosphaerae]